jgi:hypothetical protein
MLHLGLVEHAGVDRGRARRRIEDLSSSAACTVRSVQIPSASG